MLQTVAAAPVVSLFAACAYCPASTSFACLNCSLPMCPNCCPSDYCPECQPDPVAPQVVLGGWSLADEGTEDDAVAVACAACGDRFFTEDGDDAYCAACTMPAAAVAALRMMPAPARVSCLFCGNPIYRGDTDDAGTRHPRCARFLTLLAERNVKGDAIAA